MAIVVIAFSIKIWPLPLPFSMTPVVELVGKLTIAVPMIPVGQVELTFVSLKVQSMNLAPHDLVIYLKLFRVLE